MTDSDLRELDGWIAEKFLGWKQIEDGKLWRTPDDENGKGVTFRYPFKFSSDVVAFALVKREIERRGGSWNCRFDKAVKQHGDWPYWFTIWMPNLDQSVSTWGETEELAGCLAIKAAVEGR